MQQPMENTPAPSIRETISVVPTKLPDLLTTANAIQQKCADYNVTTSAKDMMFTEDGKLFFVDDERDSHKMGMTPFAFSQLCSKIGVPSNYVDKCIKSGRVDLAAENVNSWLQDFDRSLFIREYDGKIRGVLSDRYMVLDAPEILTTITENLPKQFRVKGHFLTPERLHMRLVSVDKLNVPGEDLFFGLTADSSDVGRSRLGGSFLIYKQVCTNGMVVTKGEFELFNRRHSGNSVIDFRNDFAESIHRLPELADTVAGYIRLAQKTESPVYSKDMFSTGRDRAIEKMRKIYSFTEAESGAIVDILEREKYNPSTMWGFTNAVTEAAQRFTLERRIDMENIAGGVFFDPVH
jgi:hypothetical protein